LKARGLRAPEEWIVRGGFMEGDGYRRLGWDAKDNHGTCRVMQVAAVASLTGDRRSTLKAASGSQTSLVLWMAEFGPRTADWTVD
jgi:hypothetical protein